MPLTKKQNKKTTVVINKIGPPTQLLP
uniref:Uncharacterized protein n=1 Tax=Anguilla anguilla TaxID=7936 RepID=A0A0E9XTY9_ANGAN